MSESPLSRAEDAKRRRDLPDEVRILTDANADLNAQAWYPLHVGDVVLMATGEGDLGETYVAERDEFDHDGPATALRRVSVLEYDGEPADWPVEFYDLWFEADRNMLTVVRAGRVVFGTPVHAAAPEGGDPR